MSLATRTGLSIATCGNVLQEMLRTGEIQEACPGESTGGRPSRQFQYNHDYAYYAAVYLRKEGSKNILYSSVANLAGHPVMTSSTEHFDIGMGDVEEILMHYCRKFPLVRSVALGIPGVVRQGTIGICDFPRLAGIPLVSHLEKQLDCPVIAENDVNLSALGNHFGRDQCQDENSVCLYYPRGGKPGAGIIVGKRLVRGYSHFAGEVSFLPQSESLEETSLQKKNVFIDAVSNTVQSLVSIINPQNIRLIGLDFTENILRRIQEKLRKEIPQEHLPMMHFDTDLHESLIEGLHHLAVDEISSGVRLINTKQEYRS
ncbi:MAG: ROK family protein [Spirochaetales bacterium]|nr:ROK family protein [Spirochaetales bacterium]